jgi:hypothetical protein
MKPMGEIKPFEKKIWLSSPTMHGDERTYMTQAYETNYNKELKRGNGKKNE